MKFVEKIKENKNLLRLFTIVKNRFQDAAIGNNAVIVAYYLLLSLFPLLIAVGNLLPFLKIDPNSILPYVKDIIPDEVYTFIGPAIKSLLTQGSGGVLSISALAALWSASKSINGLQTAMNSAYGVNDRKNFIAVRLVSVIVIVLLLVAIVGVTVVLGLGRMLLDGLQPILGFSAQIIDTFQRFKWPLTIVALLVIMMIIYWIVPNAKVKLMTTWPGAVVATIGWMILGQVFGLYAQFFAAKVSGYQIIGSFIVLMLWLNMAATIIILGGITNAIIAEYITGQEVQDRKGPLAKISKKIEAKIGKDDSKDSSK
ncbi:hypothetical protein EsVE80_08520 [Enterococcus saigonensis]|uniref:Uncharacterized protein n=1 Tax=Enterococcus saigonensis TaxID=1805431 RepID=A0A679IB86_9ENTE|nr:YihY/virulence factor BrkB family protein [Enterococcus saigonensis]BCA85329.1 hypothetical protein EsVE80_08520 [Enterococcus saigonensis]